MYHIRWWYLGGRYVIVSFVEPSMCGYLDTMRLGVVPKYITGSIRYVSEEYTFPGVDNEFSWTFARGANPYSASKCPEVGEIFDYIVSLCER